eukprot:s3452_g6.t1
MLAVVIVVLLATICILLKIMHVMHKKIEVTRDAMDWMRMNVRERRMRARVRAQEQARTGIYLETEAGESSEEDFPLEDDAIVRMVTMEDINEGRDEHHECAESEVTDDDVVVEEADEANLEQEGCGEEHLPAEAKEEELEEIDIDNEGEEEEDYEEGEEEDDFMTDYGSLEIIMENEEDYRDLDPEDYQEYRFQMLGEARGIEHYVVKKLAYFRQLPMNDNIWDAIRELMQLHIAVQNGDAKARTRVIDYLRNRKRYIEHYNAGRIPAGELLEESEMPDEWVAAHYGWSEISPQATRRFQSDGEDSWSSERSQNEEEEEEPVDEPGPPAIVEDPVECPEEAASSGWRPPTSKARPKPKPETGKCNRKPQDRSSPKTGRGNAQIDEGTFLSLFTLDLHFSGYMSARRKASGHSSAFPGLTSKKTDAQEDEPAPGGVDVVNHNGIRSRSLRAAHAFGKGDVLLSNAPEHVIRAADVHGRRDDACKLALYIAEARATRAKASDSYWQKALETFPEFSDFEALGVPLAASEKALATLSQVPEFQSLMPFIQQTRGTMLFAVDVYNRSAEPHPALSFSDALWGRLVVETYAFANTPCGLHLAPLASWVNHSLQPNVSYNCDAHGQVTVSALKPLAPHSELQATYNKLGPLANFAKYGRRRLNKAFEPCQLHTLAAESASQRAATASCTLASKLAAIHCEGSLPESPSLPPAAPLPAAKPTPAVTPPASAEGLQWGSVPLQPMTQIPGISNLLYGPRPYIPLPPSAWDATLPMMIPTTAHMPQLDLVALTVSDPWRSVEALKSRSRDPDFLGNVNSLSKTNHRRRPPESLVNSYTGRNTRQASRIKTAYFDVQDDDEDEGTEEAEEEPHSWPKKLKESQTVSLGSEEPQVQILGPGWRKLRAKYGGAAVMDQLLQQVRASNTQQLYDDDWTSAMASSSGGRHPPMMPCWMHRPPKALCPFRTLVGVLLLCILVAFLLGRPTLTAPVEVAVPAVPSQESNADVESTAAPVALSVQASFASSKTTVEPTRAPERSQYGFYLHVHGHPAAAIWISAPCAPLRTAASYCVLRPMTVGTRGPFFGDFMMQP